MAEYTLSMLAREFGTSKDVMKYHRKHLSDDFIRKDDKGVVWVSETGKSIIQGKLRKEDYSPNFEQEVLQSLRRLEWLLDHTGSHRGKSKSSSGDTVSVLEKIRAYDTAEKELENFISLEDHESVLQNLEQEVQKYKTLFEALRAEVVALSSSTIIHEDGRLNLNFEYYKKLVRRFPSEIKDYEQS